MKQTRFTDALMVRILRDADGAPVAVLPNKHGVSEPTNYAWRKRFVSLETMDVRRQKRLEQDNVRPQNLLALRGLEIAVMKEVASGKR